jgi:hypothetical protein
MTRCPGAWRLTLLVLAALAAAVPVTAQTILLTVQESVNGATISPPLPAREGVAGSLFDGGFIVIDLPQEAPTRGAAEMIGVARSAGADLLLDVRVQYSDHPLGGGVARISGSAAFTLTDTASGVVRAKGEEAVTNAKREKDVDRVILGQEIGRIVVARVREALKQVSR